jgi:hypothetical protein
LPLPLNQRIIGIPESIMRGIPEYVWATSVQWRQLALDLRPMAENRSGTGPASRQLQEEVGGVAPAGLSLSSKSRNGAAAGNLCVGHLPRGAYPRWCGVRRTAALPVGLDPSANASSIRPAATSGPSTARPERRPRFSILAAWTWEVDTCADLLSVDGRCAGRGGVRSARRWST